ncbi:hypothetical protein HYS95_00720 [Candidatus Daviesbacteria bacterium]|nr:hypothetical protein [Candidatus Daviesbacteria bacterium]
MKNIFFYTHLIEIESVTRELDQLDLSQEERHHLAHLVDSSIHHTILDAIFSKLSETDKKVFLNYLKDDDHQKIWNFLNEKTENIESSIKEAAQELKEQLRKDIKEAKLRGKI